MNWLLLLALTDEAVARPKAAPIPPQPDLSDPQIRLDVQLDLIEGLLDANLAQDALRVARELRALGVDAWELDLIQAKALHRLGIPSEAIPLAEAAAHRVPRQAAPWAALGVMYGDAERLDEAVAALERARRLDDSDAAVLNNLGYLELARGHAERAVDLFRESLTLDPTSSQTRNNLGFALARLERDREALDAFRAAGSEAEARYNLGVACELRRDTAGALNQYRAALDARPDFPKARSALDRLLSSEPSP